jgi:hypothetical protein
MFGMEKQVQARRNIRSILAFLASYGANKRVGIGLKRSTMS